VSWLLLWIFLLGSRDYSDSLELAAGLPCGRPSEAAMQEVAVLAASIAQKMEVSRLTISCLTY
jgi:hypothetical protein